MRKAAWQYDFHLSVLAYPAYPILVQRFLLFNGILFSFFVLPPVVRRHGVPGNGEEEEFVEEFLEIELCHAKVEIDGVLQIAQAGKALGRDRIHCVYLYLLSVETTEDTSDFAALFQKSVVRMLFRLFTEIIFVFDDLVVLAWRKKRHFEAQLGVVVAPQTLSVCYLEIKAFIVFLRFDDFQYPMIAK